MESNCGIKPGETEIRVNSQSVSAGILQAIGEILWLLIVYPLLGLVFISMLSYGGTLWGTVAILAVIIGWIYQVVNLASGKKFHQKVKQKINTAIGKEMI